MEPFDALETLARHHIVPFSSSDVLAAAVRYKDRTSRLSPVEQLDGDQILQPFIVGAAAAALCSVPDSNDAAFKSIVGSGLSANKQHQLSYRGHLARERLAEERLDGCRGDAYGAPVARMVAACGGCCCRRRHASGTPRDTGRSWPDGFCGNSARRQAPSRGGSSHRSDSRPQCLVGRHRGVGSRDLDCGIHERSRCDSHQGMMRTTQNVSIIEARTGRRRSGLPLLVVISNGAIMGSA